MATRSDSFLTIQEHTELQLDALQAISNSTHLGFASYAAWGLWCRELAVAARIMAKDRVAELLQEQVLRLQFVRQELESVGPTKALPSVA